MAENKDISLSYLFFSFLKIGSISWGGFMALISVIRKQMVEKDQTVRDETILDGISLASVLPGPLAFNIVAYLGYTLRGVQGALISMLAIILPSFFMILALASVYTTYGQLPFFRHFFAGILPAVAAVIISVAVDMFKKQVKDVKQGALCVLACFSLIFFHSFWITLLIIVIGAMAGILFYKEAGIKTEVEENGKTHFFNRSLWIYVGLGTLVLILIFLPSLLETSERYQLLRTIFLAFSGMSLTLFGGGYVIIPAMQQVIVDGFHWLNNTEFADAIAMGQITPGPIFISATFIGYRIAGLSGALVATLAIFFPPAFVMVSLSKFLEKIKKSIVIVAAFKGMRPAIIGMIFSAAWNIGKGASVSWPTPFIFLLVLLLLIRYKSQAVYLIPLSGLAGIVFYSF